MPNIFLTKILEDWTVASNVFCSHAKCVQVDIKLGSKKLTMSMYLISDEIFGHLPVDFILASCTTFSEKFFSGEL